MLIQWRLLKYFPPMKTASQLCFLPPHHSSLWFSDKLSGRLPSVCFFSFFLARQYFPDHFHLLPPLAIACSSLAILQTWLHMSLMTHVIAHPMWVTLFPPPKLDWLLNWIVAYIATTGQNKKCATSYLTLKHLLNRLLTMYKAIGLMHELRDAIFKPK